MSSDTKAVSNGLDVPADAAPADGALRTPAATPASTMWAGSPPATYPKTAGAVSKRLPAQDLAWATPEPAEAAGAPAAASPCAAQEAQQKGASQDADSAPNVPSLAAVCCPVQDWTPAYSGREALATPQSAVRGALASPQSAVRDPEEGARTPIATQEDSTSAPASSSISGRLRRFASKVLKKATSPLLPTKVFDSSAKMPLRSRRIAAQPLSKVPVAKRGEILIMKRLGLAPAQNGESSKHDFEALFEGSDRESHVEAMRELFPGEARPLRSSGRRAVRV